MAEERPSAPLPAAAPSDPRLVAEAWGAASRGYLEYWTPRLRPFHERAVEALDPPADGPLAVPGCGPGREVLLLLDRFPGRTVLATDPSAEMLAFLRAAIRERGAATALATTGAAESLSSSVRQAAGILSCFVLQLLPDPAAALGDWARALRIGGSISVVFWPRPAPESPHGRLLRAIEKAAGETRPDWEGGALEAVEPSGLALERDESVRGEMEHGSPEDYFDRIVDSGPLQLLLKRRGRGTVEACRAAWLEDHGLERRGGLWVSPVEARLWVLRKNREGKEGH